MKVAIQSRIPALSKEIKNITKRAMRAAIKLVGQDAKAKVPVDSGALRQSLSSKVDSVKGETIVYGIYGARSAFTKMVGGKLKKPSRYLHFIETGKFAKPFLLPSWQANQARYNKALQDIISSEMKKAVE